MMKFTIKAVRGHPKGRIYDVTLDGKAISLLFTFHALGRMTRWSLTDRKVLRTLLLPEEVLRGHRGRFIAHRRTGNHVVRVVYEYERKMPVVVTVYAPAAARYFQGGGIYENHILP